MRQGKREGWGERLGEGGVGTEGEEEWEERAGEIGWRILECSAEVGERV